MGRYFLELKENWLGGWRVFVYRDGVRCRIFEGETPLDARGAADAFVARDRASWVEVRP